MLSMTILWQYSYDQLGTQQAKGLNSKLQYLYAQSELIRELTSVSGVLTNLYFCKISMRAIFTSMRANLIPTQLRGPQPKGMWQRAGRFAFSSGVNLRKGGKDGRRTMEEGERQYLSGSNFSGSGQISGL